MFDKNKVLKGLECCQYPSKSQCDGCPYCYEGFETNDCTADLASDVLAMLAWQDAMPVRLTKCTVRCPKCGKELTRRGAIHREIKFCWKCGQAVIWNE